MTETPTSANTASHILATSSRAHQKHNRLNRQGKHDILVRDCHCLASDFNHTCNLRRVIIHQDNVRRLDRRVTSHASHCNTDICAGENRASLMPSPTNASSAFRSSPPASPRPSAPYPPEAAPCTLIDANLRSHRLSDRFPVARQHNSTADSTAFSPRIASSVSGLIVSSIRILPANFPSFAR